MATYYGFNPPFVSGQQNVMSRQEDERLIKNDLRQLLLTVPGERVHRPTFGTLIRASLFEPITNDTAMTLRQNIISQINTFESRVTIKDVTIIADENNNTLNIKVIVTPKYDPLTQYLVELNMTGQG